MYPIKTHRLVLTRGFTALKVEKSDGTPIGDPFPLTLEGKAIHIEIENSEYIVKIIPRPKSVRMAFQLDKIKEFNISGTTLTGIGSIDLRDIGRSSNPGDLTKMVTLECDLACTGHTIWNQGGGFGLKLYFVDLGCHKVHYS